MRERQMCIAESLMGSRALLDGRYRLDALVRRSATTTIHVATHRNGSTAWLKLPVSAAYADLITLESRIANSIGSPLVVRDDGTTPDGVPYLVLDPPEAESVATLRARGRAGARLPLARVMTAGDALARVVAAIHAMGYVTAGLEDDDVLIFASGDVALLDLHALVPATAAGVVADVMHLLGVLSGLVAEVADTSAAESSRALIQGALAARYPDVAALQAAWRAASPEPIELPSRARSGSLADIPSAPRLPAHDTPFSLSVGQGGARSGAGGGSGGGPPMGGGGEPPRDVRRDADGSVIGYLRSGGVPSAPPPAVAPRERPVMYDPLSKLAEMPRLVQATSRGSSPDARTSKSRAALAVLIAVPAMVVVIVAVALASSMTGGAGPKAGRGASEGARGVAATAALGVPVPAAGVVDEAAAPVAKASPPSVLVGAAAGASVASVASVAGGGAAAEEVVDLELTALLRSENAPPNRDVFIDGKPVGKTPLRVSVPCGRHTLQMVAGAPKQPVDLPCGGERVVRYDAKGHWSLGR